MEVIELGPPVELSTVPARFRAEVSGLDLPWVDANLVPLLLGAMNRMAPVEMLRLHFVRDLLNGRRGWFEALEERFTRMHDDFGDVFLAIIRELGRPGGTARALLAKMLSLGTELDCLRFIHKHAAANDVARTIQRASVGWDLTYTYDGRAVHVPVKHKQSLMVDQQFMSEVLAAAALDSTNVALRQWHAGSFVLFDPVTDKRMKELAAFCHHELSPLLVQLEGTLPAEHLREAGGLRAFGFRYRRDAASVRITSAAGDPLLELRLQDPTPHSSIHPGPGIMGHHRGTAIGWEPLLGLVRVTCERIARQSAAAGQRWGFVGLGLDWRFGEEPKQVECLREGISTVLEENIVPLVVQPRFDALFGDGKQHPTLIMNSAARSSLPTFGIRLDSELT